MVSNSVLLAQACSKLEDVLLIDRLIFQIVLRKRFSRGRIPPQPQIVRNPILVLISLLETSTAYTKRAVPSVVTIAQTNITDQVRTIQQLARVASQYPYYKFNYAWHKQMENSVCKNTFPMLSILLNVFGSPGR